jgi:hypothetical protein
MQKLLHAFPIKRRIFSILTYFFLAIAKTKGPSKATQSTDVPFYLICPPSWRLTWSQFYDSANFCRFLAQKHWFLEKNFMS